MISPLLFLCSEAVLVDLQLLLVDGVTIEKQVASLLVHLREGLLGLIFCLIVERSNSYLELLVVSNVN